MKEGFGRSGASPASHSISKKKKYIRPVLPESSDLKAVKSFGITAVAVSAVVSCTGSQVSEMSNTIREIPKRSVCLELTRRCPLTCDHCSMESGPGKKLTITDDNMRLWISQISEIADIVSFTGGESFVEKRLLKEAIECSHENGLKVGIVTNCFWAKTPELALKTLKEFPVFSALDVSYDKYHSPFIPFENIKNAVVAALEIGISKISLRHVHVGYDEDQKIKIQNDILKSLGDIAYDPRVSCWSQPLALGTRGMAFHPSYLGYKPTNKIPTVNSCYALETIFVDTEGYVYPCCSTLEPLPNKDDVTVGNLSEQTLSQVLDKLGSLFLPRILYEYGPQVIVKWLEQIKGKEFTKDLRKNLQYNDCCQLCTKLFSNKKYINVIGKMKDQYNGCCGKERGHLPLSLGYKMMQSTN